MKNLAVPWLLHVIIGLELVHCHTLVKRQSLADLFADKDTSDHKAEKRAGLFGSSKPVTDQDSARVEPTFKDFKLSEVVQGLLINALQQPKPVVDTIREEEKYGNSGDYFTDIGKKIVGGFEGLSVALNKAVDIPMDFARKVSSGLTDTLNNLGGKLIGLN